MLTTGNLMLTLEILRYGAKVAQLRWAAMSREGQLHMTEIHTSAPTRVVSEAARFAVAVLIAAVVATGVTGYVLAQAQPDQTAIQDVISRANNEQARALVAADPSLMADTATPDYLSDVTLTNQDLIAHGVTSIALVNLDWGPVTVNGSTASATTYETWSTTLADGTTIQSRDENDYTLTVQGGLWRITSDTHPPTSAVGSPPSQLEPPASTNATDVAPSHNWAGYAADDGSYTAVGGTWTVPTFAQSSAAGVSATWVGIGGVNSRDLIQAGTEQQTSGTGHTQYQAWIETLPQASRNVPLRVSPGDSISVSIAEQSANQWLISFDNNTTGQNYEQTVTYTSSHSSAEWIVEAPSALRGGTLPLDNFGAINFDNASVVENGQTLSMAAADVNAIAMIGPGRQALAVPSPVGSDGDSFTVTRTAVAASAQPGIGTRAAPGVAGAR